MKYRIVCTNQEPSGVSLHRAHIVTVGTGTSPDKADKQWALAEVLQALARGDEFYTQGAQSGRVARVEKYVCACGRTTIRSSPDAVYDNNLDNMRVCVWSAVPQR